MHNREHPLTKTFLKHSSFLGMSLQLSSLCQLHSPHPCSRSVKQRWNLLCTALSKSFYRFQIGFRSGSLLGHSSVDCGFVLWGCYCAGENLLHLQLSNCRFCAKIDWGLERIMIHCILTRAPVPYKEKQPQYVVLPLLHWCFLGNYAQKVQPCVVTHFTTCIGVSVCGVWKKSKF